ncbi:hypothetical protein Psi01_05330 [Planobispora siamensis]|uniref:FtsK domain-containing protein n=1 Tax=Planobispora siamensis TaxID=936338 RepID=A0A8J3S9I8_9ACTN|nr:hypothetical protein Psi01_05330 [Planobispora siamensis]
MARGERFGTRRSPRRTGGSGRRGWAGGAPSRYGDGLPYPAGAYRDRLSAGRVLAAGVRGYGRWVARAPETRGLASGLAALYPAGEVMHALGPEPLLVGALAPPLALSTWVGTYKAHRSVKYSATLTATVAAVPGWLAFAAHWGAFNLPTLVGYTSTAALAWSAFTWSDVLRERRAWQARQLRWDALATAVGLEDSKLISADDTRLGQCFRIDIRATGKRASQLARPGSGLAEDLAAHLALPTERVRISADAKHAGIIVIAVQLIDPWQGEVTHPALSGTASADAARRSIMDGPLVLGLDPDSGDDLALSVFDKAGGHHTFLVAPTGSGKTTLYNNLIEQASDRCDVLVMGIDVAKGTLGAIWGQVLDAHAGIGEYDKALQILAWAGVVITERSRASGGRNHKPSPSAPVLLILIDELDEVTGYNSPIGTQAKALVEKIYRRGRSAGVVLATASQRGVIQYTGTKDPHANADNKIVLRVNRASEMNNVIPGWELAGMPNMETYARGVHGVALVVDGNSLWRAGRVRDLSDLDAVEALAGRRGAPVACLESAIAAMLPGYGERHHRSVPASAVPSGGKGIGGGCATRSDGTDWGINPADSTAIDRLAQDMVAEIEARLTDMPAPPAQPTSLNELIAAKHAVEHADANDPAVNRAIPVPEHIARPILRLLAQRGPAGARRDELVAAVGRSRSVVAGWLAILRDHGSITALGAGRAARYYLREYAPGDDASEGYEP